MPADLLPCFDLAARRNAPVKQRVVARHPLAASPDGLTCSRKVENRPITSRSLSERAMRANSSQLTNLLRRRVRATDSV